MRVIEFGVDCREISELGLLMTTKYGDNLAKQYLVLRAVAEVLQMLTLQHAPEAERKIVERTRRQLDSDAVRMAKAVFEEMIVDYK